MYVNDSASHRSAASSLAGLALPLFSATLFLSAFLLFSVQPFFAKLVLPKLGGSPAVWSIAMVFFQSVLLAGYAWAHLLASRVPLLAGVLLHLCVLAVAATILPLGIADGWDRPSQEWPAIWLLGLFTVSVGLPFFAVSATGPLLQAWFSRTGHPHAHDPYFLYGASNLGSFASLILFIVAIEPLLSVPAQADAWTAGYLLLAAAIAGCGFLAIRLQVPAAARPADAVSVEPVVAASPWRWMLFAAVPSGLLVAVTAHISVDVAAAPFLWVVPLALFLLTFTLAFRRTPLVSVAMLSRFMPTLGGLAIVAIFAHSILPIWAGLAIHLGFFFAAALFCHARLVEIRPPAARLTAFYFFMSLGGVCGGIFASLLAPVLFDWVAEYLLLIVAVMLLRPEITKMTASDMRSLAIAAVMLCGLVFALAASGLVEGLETRAGLAFIALTAALVMAGAHFLSQRIFALSAVLIVPIGFLHAWADGDLYIDRTFFGVVKVTETADRRFRLMTHGTTLHGAMRVRDDQGNPVTGRPEPLTYYHATGGIAAAIAAMQERRGGAMGEVGAVGLGTGSVLCDARPGERWTMFEIDPSVLAAASDPALFGFMSQCGPDVPTVIGDARLTLQDKPDGAFDLLLIDAFSSDSIPVHLMTREAIAIYRAKLREDGMLVIHISNRYLELESVLAAIAREEGLVMKAGVFSQDGQEMTDGYIGRSQVAVMVADEADLGQLNADPRWKVSQPGDTQAWTDDYSNIIAALLRRM